MEDMWFCKSLLDCLIESTCMFRATERVGDEVKVLLVIALLALEVAPLALVVISRDSPRPPDEHQQCCRTDDILP